jgi:hypothetical protein
MRTRAAAELTASTDAGVRVLTSMVIMWINLSTLQCNDTSSHVPVPLSGPPSSVCYVRNASMCILHVYLYNILYDT